MRYHEKEYKVCIWDTAGEEKFKSVTESYFKGSNVAIVVFAIDDRASFNKCGFWVDAIKNIEKDVKLVIVGNKSDLQRAIELDECENLAKVHNGKYVEVSAKTGDQINDLFSDILGSISMEDLKKKPKRKRNLNKSENNGSA
eukprot:CAMPEP_0116892430 /NCGR_PEP_ID=MMETSP0467-20121206/2653_1 /TAXON_ID=283647 /ORGANISM="Mesodinium pulex, Strain SPMC105" /LENGTH=141 /DNA_ID=CAMNT_0004561551 /DNA_START=164 /DNA_END=586 /DNA_ORIENTATION=+